MEMFMSQRPFSFLHAADLHIDRPLAGVSDAPAPLVDLFVDAPLKAAERIFDAAIDQQVDFVVLSGDVIDEAEAGPREWLFLVDQFERLAERKISIYWCGGASDSRCDWPTYVSWPRNVR